MTVSSDYLVYVLDQLAGLGGVSSRRMFGGAGLYCNEFFFGLIADDVRYLRVDDSNRNDYAAHGMKQFKPYADRAEFSMNYYEAPAGVLENAGELVGWARRSVEVAKAVSLKSERQTGSGRVKHVRPAPRARAKRAK